MTYTTICPKCGTGASLRRMVETEQNFYIESDGTEGRMYAHHTDDSSLYYEEVFCDRSRNGCGNWYEQVTEAET